MEGVRRKQARQAARKPSRPATELRQAYPHGKWINECGALEIEIRGKSDDPLPPQAEQDEELKLLALNSLMQQDESRALPIIQQILNSDKSEKLKARALFVLAQDQSPQAQALLGQVARGERNPALQRKAIEMLAIARGKQSAETLADIYRQSTNERGKERHSPHLSHHRHSRSAGGSGTSRIESRNSSAQRCTPWVRWAQPRSCSLSITTPAAPRPRPTSSTALIPAGQKGAEALGSIAGSEQDPELRRKAIRNLGVAGGMSAAPSLVATYKKNSDPETRKAVVQALFLAGDSHDLVELARAEKDPAIKQAIVQQLSIMHSKEATDYMLEILNK